MSNMNPTETSKFNVTWNENRIYLASTYTHADKEVMAFRYKEALQTSARLINKGYLIFSPIVHCHPLAVKHALPVDYKFWQAYSDSFLLYWAEAVAVLCLQGIFDSKGVEAEIVLAKGTGLPVYYI
jgi:hypothetical protein